MALSLMGLPTTNLTPGTSGSTVQQLQQWLVNNGYMTQADMNTGPGIYGPKTQAAVTSLQRNLGVNTNGNDGYWGPATISAITSSATPTSTTSTSQAMNYGTTAPVVPTTTNTSNALSIPSSGSISGLSNSVSTPATPTVAPQPQAQNTLTVPTSGTIPGLSGSLTTPAPTATSTSGITANLFPGALTTGTYDYGSVKQLQDALMKMGYMTENEMYQGRGAYATNTVAGVQKLQNELKSKGYLSNIDSPGNFTQSTVDALNKYLSAPQASLGSVSGAMSSLQNAQNSLTTPTLPPLTSAGSTAPTLPSVTGSSTPTQSLTPTGLPTLPSVAGTSTSTAPTTGGAISTSSTPRTGVTSMTPAGQGTGAPTLGLPTIPQLNTGSVNQAPPGAPTTPTIAGQSALEKQYQGLITPAQAETDTQTMINNLLASKQMGLNSIADQAIPMGFITGQQASVERRAQGQLIPLQQKMALLQAQRQSALEATKFALDREDKAKATETANKAKTEIVDVDGQKKLVNTITGEIVKDIGTSTASTTLTPAQKQGALNSVVDDFYKDPAVKNLSDASSGYNTLQTLTNKQGRTSADNIAAIYAFAKIMDPGSVVREGEYATVQKYAQAWAESFGMNVQRILSNQEFLTDEAMRNLASAAQAKYQSLVAGYNQVLPSYEKRIQDINNGIINTQLPTLNTTGTSGGSSSGAVAGYSW